MNNNNKYLLGSLAVGRNNNLDIIRFIAASLVIISHAFPIINGVGNCDYLDRATNEFISLGGLAVSIFLYLVDF